MPCCRPFSHFHSLLQAGWIVTVLLLAGCDSLPTATTTAVPIVALTDSLANSGQPTVAANTDAQAYDDLWDRLRAGFCLHCPADHPRVKAALQWYTRNQTYFNQLTQRAAPYLHFIVQEVEARKLPLELALMPAVESAFDPFAYSHAGASGLWQIMPSTGKQHGLVQTGWYDPRRDVMAATRMALAYMHRLYQRFGDWQLALAAYNAGPGTVRQAMKKHRKSSKPMTFWQLHLPNETTAYVPKLIALASIIKAPAQHGIRLPALPNKPYFTSVAIDGQLDLAQAATLADMALADLCTLNPGLNRRSTPPDGPHHLVVPASQAASFSAQLAALPAEQRLQWHRYTVQAGDNLQHIAKRYRTDTKHIQSVNGLTTHLIRVKQVLWVPVSQCGTDEYACTLNQRSLLKQNRPVSGRQKQRYRVKAGDSLWAIARRYQVRINELARWNQLAFNAPLRINQTLTIWTTAPG